MGNAEKIIGYATIHTEKCRRPSQGMQLYVMGFELLVYIGFAIVKSVCLFVNV
jgi:hypothetical protein